MGRPHGPYDPKGAENDPFNAISDAHFCKFDFVFLWERSWTNITPNFEGGRGSQIQMVQVE